jgi:hypothetical protein
MEFFEKKVLVEYEMDEEFRKIDSQEKTSER